MSERAGWGLRRVGDVAAREWRGRGVITVANAEDAQLVAAARGHVVGEAGWLVFHIALASFAAVVAYSEVTGVWPALFWLLAGAVAGDALSGSRSVWIGVRDWRRLRGSAAFRGLTRDLDEAGQRARESYRAARRAEAGAAHGRVGGLW